MSQVSEEVVHGQGYDCFAAGPMESWMRFRLAPPETPLPARGKYFLRKYLNSDGLEMSINALPAGREMPFVHRHKENDEIYYVIQGRGQFQAGTDVFDVSEGFFIRLSPEVPRVWRNNSEEPLYYLVIQYRADSCVTGTIQDGERLEDYPIAWKAESDHDAPHGP